MWFCPIFTISIMVHNWHQFHTENWQIEKIVVVVDMEVVGKIVLMETPPPTAPAES